VNLTSKSTRTQNPHGKQADPFASKHFDKQVDPSDPREHPLIFTRTQTSPSLDPGKQANLASKQNPFSCKQAFTARQTSHSRKQLTPFTSKHFDKQVDTFVSPSSQQSRKQARPQSQASRRLLAHLCTSKRSLLGKQANPRKQAVKNQEQQATSHSNKDKQVDLILSPN
jgi:hypothetical protein